MRWNEGLFAWQAQSCGWRAIQEIWKAMPRIMEHMAFCLQTQQLSLLCDALSACGCNCCQWAISRPMGEASQGMHTQLCLCTQYLAERDLSAYVLSRPLHSYNVGLKLPCLSSCEVNNYIVRSYRDNCSPRT